MYLNTFNTARPRSLGSGQFEIPSDVTRDTVPAPLQFTLHNEEGVLQLDGVNMIKLLQAETLALDEFYLNIPPYLFADTMAAMNTAAGDLYTNINNKITLFTPSATPGPDQSIAHNATCTLSAATKSANTTSVLWVTSGTGTFNDATALHPVYTPSAADKTAGTVYLSIVASNAYYQNVYSPSLTLTILP